MRSVGFEALSMCDVESWCKVEGSSQGEWMKAQRKHCPSALQSDIFGQSQPVQDDMWRSEWINAKPEPQKRRERRHFLDKGQPLSILTVELIDRVWLRFGYYDNDVNDSNV